MACEIIIPIKLGRISSLTQPTRGPFLIAQMDDSTFAVTVAFYPYIRSSEGPSEKKRHTFKKGARKLGMLTKFGWKNDCVPAWQTPA